MVITSERLNEIIGLMACWDKWDRYAALEYAQDRLSAQEFNRRVLNLAYMKQRADHAVELLALLGIDEKYTRRAMADAQAARGIK